MDAKCNLHLRRSIAGVLIVAILISFESSFFVAHFPATRRPGINDIARFPTGQNRSIIDKPSTDDKACPYDSSINLPPLLFCHSSLLRTSSPKRRSSASRMCTVSHRIELTYFCFLHIWYQACLNLCCKLKVMYNNCCFKSHFMSRMGCSTS